MYVLFNWKVTAFSLTCVLVFVHLGLWQLERAGEKEVLIIEQQAIAGSDPLPGSMLTHETQNGTPVHLRGRFDTERVLLLDNRIVDGVVGYEVLMLFRDVSLPDPVLVNRGFLPMGRTRSDLPRIPELVRLDMAEGRLYWQSEGKPVFPVSGWPKVIQATNPVEIGNIMDESIYPHVVRLSESDPNALPRDWPLTVIRPEKHLGYAVQWFLMATAVVIAYGFFTLRRGRDHGDED
ncbi:MAG: SURF1 family protein [Proteobacteria bacterium]|jgi:surfeit locus 1 family protein|nr:SURF1 family protein [Pseudomonadota bacterium]MDA1299730.1 SURF1 family protein [Pseudomonadota bacterium]